jgi:hypothetical protein
LADYDYVSRNGSLVSMPDTAIGALAAVGVVALLVGMVFGTGKGSAAEKPATKSAATKTRSVPTSAPSAPSPKAPTNPAPGSAPGGDPVAVSDPAPPKAPASRCGLDGASSRAGGATWLADMTVGFAPDAKVDEVSGAIASVPWASGYVVHSGFEVYSGTASVTVSVPPEFSKADFAVAEKWFKALPGFKRFEQSRKPSTAAIGCLNDVADIQRLEQVLTDLVLAGKIDGYTLLSSGLGVELQLPRNGSDRDWKGLEATFSSFGTIGSWTVFDAWPPV